MGASKRARFALAAVLVATATLAQADGHRDAKAIDVLTKMDAYTDAMSAFTVEVEAFTDAAIDSSLVISNPSRSVVTVDRSGSLHSITETGRQIQEIYFHDGELILYSDRHNTFSKAEVPDDLGEALLFALSEFQLETPVMDLLLVNSLEHFVGDMESVIYLGGNRLIRDVECHHVVITGPHLDLQIFIEQGDNPVPRATIMTLKGDLGRPRHEVHMEWSETSRPKSSEFEFSAPDGAKEIDFIEIIQL